MQRATRVLRKAAHSHGHSDGNKYGGACCAALHAMDGSGKPFTLLLLAPTPSLPPLPGFHAPHVDPFHQNMATIIGATMWFWIFYRFREDGGVLLVRACLAQRGPCPQVRQPRPAPPCAHPRPLPHTLTPPPSRIWELQGFHKPWEAHAHDEGHGDEEHGHGAGHDEHSKELR